MTKLATPARQKRVLVVDDNPDAASMMLLLLQDMGQAVFVARDGARALELAGEVRPDIVFLDIAMPGQDGYEVASRMRQQLGASVRIFAISGFARSREVADDGFDQYLVKPVDPAFLKSLLG